MKKPHLLNRKWSFWVTKCVETEYHDRLEQAGHVQTVEDFWNVYLHLRRPSEHADKVDLCLFQEGISPEWEDESNINGGRVTVRLRKGYGDICFEKLLLGLVGGVFNSTVCGIVFCVRKVDDVLTVWNNTTDTEEVENVKKTMLLLLDLKDDSPFEYRTHLSSIKKLGVQPQKEAV
ncbi:MAG: translation initiation factor eIF4E type 2 [Amphiamblys sp. WSBS2006]|nr:MAG: translation initiation factor eIF4E type 2 [Amphiamblys sp. WSBS2006]